MPDGWEEEVKDILERAEELEMKTGRRRPIPLPSAPRPRGNPIVGLGDFLRKRVATNRDTAATGMILIFAGLLLIAIPGVRFVTGPMALVGVGLLVAAYISTYRQN
ncbi:MAG TPA: hypothetical protein QGG37_04795, partial [Chloroflexota bacterium]|nr:hypothetical protein [Chloroflexota bacterium]